jgi:hypothetical protein
MLRLPKTNLRYQVALDRRKMDKRRKANSLFVRAFCSSCHGQPEAGSLSGTVTTELAGTERVRARVMMTLRRIGRVRARAGSDGSGHESDEFAVWVSRYHPRIMPLQQSDVHQVARCRYNSPPVWQNP